MKHIKLYLLLFMGSFIFLSVFVACSATKATSSSTSASSTGQEIEQAYCKSCHGLPTNLASYTTAAKWESVISRMETSNNANLSSMTAEQRQTLIDYLVASSTD